MPTDDELLSGKDKELWFEAEALWEADHPKIPFRAKFVSRERASESTRDSATESQQLEYLRRALAARPPA